jgi:hypothetical protein
MDEPMGSTTTPVWAVVSVVGLVIFLAILLVISVILIVRKKTKKQRLTKFAKSRLAMWLQSCYYYSHEHYYLQ